MSGSVAVVAGAARGMGLACAERRARRGSTMVLVDRDGSVETVARAFASTGSVGSGNEVTAVVCDVTDAGAVADLAAKVQALGSLRELVHAASVSPTMGDWRKMFQVDLIGTALVVEAFRPLADAGTAAVCFASVSAHLLTADPGHAP
jgi:NAD(P)-dependent dehydrogenase (short-subunit alcohol dehydrogenase family)